MKIQEIPTTKIKPDPDQPRKSFEPTRIKEMAKSILTEGVINAIEVDEGYVIITGEMRWRSAKEAGLKMIPCKVMKISKDRRLLRQMIENVHHNTMSPMDTARGLDRLLTPGLSKRAGDLGHSDLGKKIGKSVMYISDHLALLEESKTIQEKLSSRKSKYTIIREINRRSPEKYKKPLKNKYIEGQFDKAGREGAQAVAQAIKQRPKYADKLIKKNYTKMRATEVRDYLHKNIPGYTETPFSQELAKALDRPKQLGVAVGHLVDWLRSNTPGDVGKHNMSRVLTNLTIAKKEIDKWLTSN